jgi:hypothetical protein
VPPWFDTGIELRPGEAVTVLAAGRAILSTELDLVVYPDMQLWYRTGEQGRVFRGTRQSLAAAKEWHGSEDRMEADAMYFDPSQERIFTGRDGLTHFNLWERPLWAEVSTELANAFIDHVAYLIPDERCRDDFLDWLAAPRSGCHSAPCSGSGTGQRAALRAGQRGVLGRDPVLTRAQLGNFPSCDNASPQPLAPENRRDPKVHQRSRAAWRDVRRDSPSRSTAIPPRVMRLIHQALHQERGELPGTVCLDIGDDAQGHQ